MPSTFQSNSSGGTPSLVEARIAYMNVHMAQGFIRGINDTGRLDAIQDHELNRPGGPRDDVVAALNQRRRDLENRDQPVRFTSGRISRECPDCGRRGVLSEYEFKRSILRRAEEDAPNSEIVDWGRAFVESDATYICVSCRWRTKR